MGYQQYLELDLNTLSEVSGYRLEALLRDTPLEGLGKAFVDTERKYHMHAVYLLAHTIHESGFGRSQIAREKKNLFGFMAYDRDPYGSAMKFDSYEHCIDYCAGYIKRQYLTPGGKWYAGPTLVGMNVHYATDKQWAEKVARWMDRLYTQLGKDDYSGHWSEGDIREALELGILSGYPDGTVRPDSLATRAEVISLIMSAIRYLKGGVTK